MLLTISPYLQKSQSYLIGTGEIYDEQTLADMFRPGRGGYYEFVSVDLETAAYDRLALSKRCPGATGKVRFGDTLLQVGETSIPLSGPVEIEIFEIDLGCVHYVLPSKKTTAPTVTNPH